MHKFSRAQARDAIKSVLDAYLDKKLTLKAHGSATNEILHALGYRETTKDRRGTSEASSPCIVSVGDGENNRAVQVKPLPYGSIPGGRKPDGVTVGKPEV